MLMKMRRWIIVIQIIQISQSCRWSVKQCGCWFNDTTKELNDRILGGFESIPHSWPWMVNVRKRSSTRPLGFSICVGTLISERHVLSAAHCFYETLKNQKDSIEQFLFVIGTYYSNDDRISSTSIHSNRISRQKASTIILHENYNPFRQTDDIALIELRTPLDFHQIQFGAICLPKVNVSQWPDYPDDGTWTVAIGWGRLSESDQQGSDALQQVKLAVEEGSQCDRIKSGRTIQTQLCAGDLYSSDSRDTCQGDSGGPLMTRSNENHWQLVGITSYGKGCGRPDQLAVYTRVTMYLSWVDQHLRLLADRSSKSIQMPKHIYSRSIKNICHCSMQIFTVTSFFLFRKS